MAEGLARDAEAPACGRSLPLKSRRLTAAHLRVIAQALGLSTSGSADQLRQCIEGHLESQENKTASNTLVIVRDIAKVETTLVLADAEGVFLEAEPVSRECQESVTDTWRKPNVS